MRPRLDARAVLAEPPVKDPEEPARPQRTDRAFKFVPDAGDVGLLVRRALEQHAYLRTLDCRDIPDAQELILPMSTHDGNLLIGAAAKRPDAVGRCCAQRGHREPSTAARCRLRRHANVALGGNWPTVPLEPGGSCVGSGRPRPLLARARWRAKARSRRARAARWCPPFSARARGRW